MLKCSFLSANDTGDLPEAFAADVADVGMGVLPDGTIYTAKTVLYAQAKGLTVTVANTGYRKIVRAGAVGRG